MSPAEISRFRSQLDPPGQSTTDPDHSRDWDEKPLVATANVTWTPSRSTMSFGNDFRSRRAVDRLKLLERSTGQPVGETNWPGRTPGRRLTRALGAGVSLIVDGIDIPEDQSGRSK